MNRMKAIFLAASVLAAALVLAGCGEEGRHVRRGTVVLLVPSSSKVVTDDFAAQVAGRVQRNWRNALRVGAATDPAKRFPSPPRAWLGRRLREAQRQYGFHVVRVVMLRPCSLAPLVVISASDKRALAHATAAILRRLDPKRVTNDDRTGWTYEGFFFEAQDRRGVPFLITFNSWRGPHAGGGQWAANEELYPFPHG